MAVAALTRIPQASFEHLAEVLVDPRRRERGVLLALLVDDQDESIRVFRPGQEMSLIRSSGRIELDEIAPGLALSAEEIFAALMID